jgi:hypothetical protein
MITFVVFVVVCLWETNFIYALFYSTRRFRRANSSSVSQDKFVETKFWGSRVTGLYAANFHALKTIGYHRIIRGRG